MGYWEGPGNDRVLIIERRQERQRRRCDNESRIRLVHYEKDLTSHG